MDLMIFVVFIICLAVIIVILGTSHPGRIVPPSNSSPIEEKSHAWHEPTGEYGSNHADIVDMHVVPHAQPEAGYVVLNGIKRKLEDCKWL